MSLQEYYEDSFKTERGQGPRDMLALETHLSKGMFSFVQVQKNKFLTHLEWKGLKILEMGSGRGGLSLHFARLGADVTLLDFSPSALVQAEQMFAVEGFVPKTIVADVSHPDVLLEEKYDIIVDSHLLHCLTMDPERFSYLSLVRDQLTERGIFVAESMVHRKKLFIPDGFMFDPNNVLWQMFGEWKPVRRILDSLDLESELKMAGLTISYFMYYANYGFVPHKQFMEIPTEILPAGVRLVLQKQLR